MLYVHERTSHKRTCGSYMSKKEVQEAQSKKAGDADSPPFTFSIV